MFLNLYCYLLRQVFNSDEYKKTISIPIVNDHEFEPDTDFYIILRNPEGDAGLGDPSVARVTIIDDDGESPARMWRSSAGVIVERIMNHRALPDGTYIMYLY